MPARGKTTKWKKLSQKNYTYRQIGVFFNERELRRYFVPVDRRSLAGKRWHSLELTHKNVRFIYELDSDTYYWQVKRSTGSHGLVCPTVERCYHAMEGKKVATVTAFASFVPRSFFFSKPATYKTILDRVHNVIAYARETKSAVTTGILELETGRHGTDVNSLRAYYSMARKYRALNRPGRLFEPKVYVFPSSATPVKPVVPTLYAIKWDGVTRYRYLIDPKAESHWSELTLILAGNKYCCETFADRSLTVVVDVYDARLSPVSRADHLQVLYALFSSDLHQRHGVLIQRFDADVKLLRPVPKSMEDLPSDGIIRVCARFVTKFKDPGCHTVDLLAVDTAVLRDLSGRLFRLAHGYASILTAGEIYEVSVVDRTVVKVCKKRSDKLFPNPSSTVDAAIAANHNINSTAQSPVLKKNTPAQKKS